jgi:site-specific DNA-methyltransferase (adenine-specific)
MTPYYQDETVCIYHGDCREVLPFLPKTDLLLTDPPFYLPAQVTASRSNWPRSLSDVAIMESYFHDVFTELVGRLRKTGAFYTFCDSTSYAVFYSIAYPLFDRTMCIVWDKGSGGLGSGWRHSHELIVHGAFADTVFEPSFRRNVIPAKRVKETLVHPSEKPVEVITRLIEAHPPGLVLDPFMGSGTTLVAAKRLGRKAIGIERERKYCDLAIERLAQGALALEVTA